MNKLIKTSEVAERVADGAAGLSVASASWAWLAQLNEILTTVATIIAIVSGIYAIRFHMKNKKDE